MSIFGTQEYVHIWKVSTMRVFFSLCNKCLFYISFFVSGSNDKKGITYWGWVNHGVSHTLTPPTNHAHINNEDKLTIITSRSHSANIEEIIRSIQEKDNIDINHIIAGGAGYKTVQVLQDKANAYVHASKIKKWDTCAGNAIIDAVGGVMTTLGGDVVDYNYKSGAIIKDGLLTVIDSGKHQRLLDDILYSTKQS